MSEPVADFLWLENLVSRYFPLKDSFIQFNIPTFILDSDAETKKSFLKLYWELRKYNYLPVLRRVKGEIVLKVVRYPSKRKRSPLIFWILFIATLLTIIYSGWLQLSSPALDLVDPHRNIWLNVFLYVFCFMMVAGLHELGHKVLCIYHGVESTLPYFIPGPPQIGGTMGAVIIQESPVVNRDQLFDVGLSGPIFGFFASIFVTILGVKLSYVLPPYSIPIGSYLPTPIIFDFIVSIFKPMPPNSILLLHPVAFAGWIGFLLTFLNIMPIAQLDGGHVSRAIFGEKKHKLISYIAIFILFITGFFFMAILALAMLSYRRHPGPLDDVSPLSMSRKIFGLIVLPTIIALTFVTFFPSLI